MLKRFFCKHKWNTVSTYRWHDVGFGNDIYRTEYVQRCYHCGKLKTIRAIGLHNEL